MTYAGKGVIIKPRLIGGFYRILTMHKFSWTWTYPNIKFAIGALYWSKQTSEATIRIIVSILSSKIHW
jgi:hypothetical protein